MRDFFTPRRTRGLVFLMLLALFLPQLQGFMVTPVEATMTQAQIDALEAEADELAAQLADLKSELSAVTAEKDSYLAQKSNLEQQLNLIQSEINNIQSQIDQYDLLIAEKMDDVALAEAEEAAQFELFCQRVRIMEEGGETSYWSILFSAGTFSELLDSFNMIEEIIAYDNGVMDQLILLRQNLEEEQLALEEARADQETAYALQVVAKNELAAKEAEIDAIIATITSQESQLSSATTQLENAAAAMDAEIAAAEEELRKQLAAAGNSIVSEAGFIWPLDASYNVLSSLFGSRIHPITGLANNHTGIDLPAPSGTNIYATKSGVVSISQYNSSYGYYCVITHADGQSTLYAHQRVMPIVSVGDSVTQGDVIGYVGTTGSSTGNHLHYEIREDGTRVDPVDYYPSYVLYVQSGGVSVLLDH